MAKAATGISADRLAAYERLVASLPEVERKGATMPYTSRNGHMFSFLTRSGSLVLRLSAGDREAFMKKYRTTLHTAHGRVMQEFVEVPDGLLAKLQELRTYLERSYAYVGSLKPKATTRTATANKAASKPPARTTRARPARNR